MTILAAHNQLLIMPVKLPSVGQKLAVTNIVVRYKSNQVNGSSKQKEVSLVTPVHQNSWNY